MKKKPSRILVNILMLLLLASGCVDYHSVNNDWPMFGRTAEGNRVAPDSAGPKTDKLELKWLWEKDIRGSISSDIVIEKNKAFFQTSFGVLFCCNLEPLYKIWEHRTGEAAAGISSSPAISNGKVYFVSEDGKFHCLNAENGQKAWEYETDARILSSPAISNGKVYVCSNDGRLYCFGDVD